MSYRFGAVHAINFGPFVDSEFDLSQPGLTLIEGEMHGIPGCISNGAGKSFLLEAITWATFDRCIRPDYSGDDIIHLGGKGKGTRGGTAVTVSLLGADVRWCRYRGHPVHKNKLRLWVDDAEVTAGTNAETQKNLERYIGYDYVGFTTTTAFGARGDVKSFFAASDTDRKRVLDAVLRLDRYDAVYTCAVARAKALAEEQSSLASKRDVILGRIQALKDCPRPTEEDTTALTGLKVRVRLLESQAAASATTLSDAKTQHALENAKVKMAESAAAKEEAEKQAIVRKAMLAQAAAETKLSTLRKEVASRKAAVEDAASQVGTDCPECGQEITEACMQHVRDEAVARLAEAQAALKAALAEPKIVVPMLESSAKVNRTILDAAQEAVTAATAHYNELALALKDRQRDVATLVAAFSKAKALDAQIATQEKELEALDATLVQAAADLRLVQFWVEGFGKSGLKSFLLECELSEINARATAYAQRLLGPGTRVLIEATRKLKSRDVTKEELSVRVDIPGCTEAYAGASTGQKRRLDLSLLLALRDVAIVRSGVKVDQFFADELFDGVDKAGCETVGVLLQELSQSYPITLITHSDALKSIATRVIRVVHKGANARLVAA